MDGIDFQLIVGVIVTAVAATIAGLFFLAWLYYLVKFLWRLCVLMWRDLRAIVGGEPEEIRGFPIEKTWRRSEADDASTGDE